MTKGRAARSTSTYYMRVESVLGLLLPLELWAADDFEHHERQDYMLQAWYFGMALFNLMLFITLRNRIYLVYVGFVLLVMLTMGIRSGMVSEFVWPRWVVWSAASYFTSASLAMVCFMHLIFFVAAFTVLLAGSVLTPLRALGIVPTNALTVDGVQIGGALEMLLIAFALAERYNALRRERLRAQQDLLAVKEQLLEMSRMTERNLEQRVDERTKQLLAMNRKLEALSLLDPLTGIANRRQFEQTLRREWTRMERLGQPLALVMLDVDSFKIYNDKYGHPAGDECLRNVAQAIFRVSRSNELVARYGGEEFAVIAPDADGQDALHIAQRARSAVEALGLPHGGSDQGVVTVSCGVASATPGPDSTLESLLRRADNALYAAKARGRNQVVLAPDAVWHPTTTGI